MLMEKNCDIFSKNCRNKHSQIFISLSIRAVSGKLRGHLTEAPNCRCSQTLLLQIFCTLSLHLYLKDSTVSPGIASKEIYKIYL